MKLAQYVVGGSVQIVDAPEPTLPKGGLIVQTEACGLCSGELMTWYLDRKAPHVLGHEVAGKVIESDDPRFPVGSRVFPHHHAPCMACTMCAKGSYVHCAQWKRTKLDPGGMAERFAVSADNLSDTILCDDLSPKNTALIEPLACCIKSLWKARYVVGEPAAVVGLGTMGLLHLLMMPGAVGYDTNPKRVEWARSIGLDARGIDASQPADCVIVCPGNQSAFEFGMSLLAPESRLCLFAPFPPSTPVSLDLEKLYFADFTLTTAYSCGPEETKEAHEILGSKIVDADQIVSEYVGLDDLPKVYQSMKNGEIIKAMVLF